MYVPAMTTTTKLKHQVTESDTTMGEDISDRLLKVISKLALITGFVVKFSKATFHAVIPSIVRLLYWDDQWASKQRPVVKLIKNLYSLRKEDYWVSKTATGRLKGINGSFFKK